MESYFVFENGSFRVDQSPPDFDELGPIGFHPSQTVGETCGLSYTLYSKADATTDTETEFIVEFHTSLSGCTIRVKTWPDLIEILGKLSSICMAGIIDTEDIQAIQNALKPYRRR